MNKLSPVAVQVQSDLEAPFSSFVRSRFGCEENGEGSNGDKSSFCAEKRDLFAPKSQVIQKNDMFFVATNNNNNNKTT